MKDQEAKRQTGRTTRMLQEAIRLALEGKRVYVVFNCLTEVEAIKRGRMRELLGHEGRSIGIRFVTPESEVFDWQTLRPRGVRPLPEVLVDHWVIERRFGKLFEMMTRFDQEA